MELTQNYQLVGSANSQTITQGALSGHYVGRLYAKYSNQDTVNRTAKVWLKLTFQLVTNGYWGIYDNSAYTQTLVCDGVTTTAAKKVNGGAPIYLGTGELEIYEQAFDVSYGTDGTWANKTLSGNLKWWSSSYNATPTGTVSLPEIHIGAYTISSITETSFVANWQSNETPTQIRVTAKQGAVITEATEQVTTTSGSVTVNGLLPNTSTIVTVYGTFNGYESQIGYQQTITTQPIPYAHDLSDLVIGNALTVPIANPNARTYTVQLWATNRATYVYQKTNQSGTSVSFTNAQIHQALYQAIASGQRSNTYWMRTIYNGHTMDSPLAYYSINSAYNLPQMTLQGVTRVSDSTGTTEDPNGAYAKVTYEWSVSNVDGNTAIQIVHTQYHGTTVVSTQTVSLSGTSGTTSIVFACDTDKQYTINSKLYDQISTWLSRYSSQDAIVPKAYMPLSLFEDDNGNVGARFGLQAVQKGWDFVTKNGDFPVMIDGVNIFNIFLKRTLLWTNPATSLASGTISLDLSGYTHIIVGGYAWSGTSGYAEAICPVGNSSVLSYIGYSTDNVSSTERFMNRSMRNFSCTTTGVTFDSGQMTYTGNLYRNWNDRMVPKWIWGVNL